MSASCVTPLRPAPPCARPPGDAPSPTTGDTTAPVEAAELLRRAGQGDPTAWEEIMRRYSDLVAGKARACRLQDADALDAVQTTWLRLAENLHRIQHPECLAGWLATTAARECLRILRQDKRSPPLTDALVDRTADPAPSPEQQVIDAHTAQALRTLIAQLPSRRRRLLRALFTDHPASYAELSRATGIPLGSIGPTRNRALHQLRRKLQDLGFLLPDSPKAAADTSSRTGRTPPPALNDPAPARTGHTSFRPPPSRRRNVLDKRRHGS